MEKEIWKDIPNYENSYQVSNLGRVKTKKREFIRNNGLKMVVNKKILKPSISKNYYCVGLSGSPKRKMFKIHQLVAMAFLDHKPCGHKVVVDHINNNKLDNRLENLQLITNRENASKDRDGYTSKYVGVSWDKNRSKWVSAIFINGTQKSLGRFKNEIDAHIAYQKELNKFRKNNE